MTRFKTLARRWYQLLCFPSTIVRSAELLLTGALCSIVASTVWTSRLLRPIADDYAFGVVASDGLLASVFSWWNNWSGDLTGMFVLSLLVGMPLAFLPWSLASAVPFLSASFFMAALGLRFQRSCFLNTVGKTYRNVQLIRFTSLLAAWWGYWWLPVPQTPVESQSYALALAATHWQNVVVGYTMPAGILCWAWLSLRDHCDRDSWKHSGAFLGFGLLVGFCGPVFATSSLFLLMTGTVSSWFRKRSFRSKDTAVSVLVGIGTVSGAVCSNLSPGSQYRATQLSTPAPDTALMLRLLREKLPLGFWDWFSAVGSLSSLLVIIVTGGVTYLLAPRLEVTRARSLFRSGCVLLGFALIYSLASRAGELFAYEAFWHLIGPRSFMWLGLVSVGTSLGMFLTLRFDLSSIKLSAIMVLAVGLYFLLGAVDLMNRQIIDRHEQWELGPAPVYDISDINDPFGGFLQSWEKLTQLRDAPERAIP